MNEEKPEGIIQWKGNIENSAKQLLSEGLD